MNTRRPDPTPRDPTVLDGWQMTSPLDHDVARRTVRVSALIAACASLSFALIYVFTGPAAFLVPNTVAGIALVAIAYLPFRSWRVQIYFAVSVGLALLTVQLLLLGRVDTGSTVWFLVPPLAAMLVGARRLALACAAVAVTVITVVALAGELGWPILGDVVLPNPDLVMALSVFGTMIAAGAVADVTLRARQTLMTDVEARTIDLAGALQEARAARAVAIEAAEAKDRFFANLTHEIRTPLNGIAGTAELLHAADLPAEERAMADALLTSTHNLVSLVNTMLEHARLRAGRVDVVRGPVRIRGLARDVEALFGAQAADKGVDLRVEVADGAPAWIETDAIKIGQIVGNLVGNAVKFTDHGRIDAAFDYEATTGDDAAGRLIVTVSDTGIGIPAGFADAVFEPFVQGDASMTRAHGGTGLGLAIASQLAGLLGGSVVVSSVPGAGSTFRLDVLAPVAAGAPETPATRATQTAAACAPLVRVLLAEDNDVNQIVASRMLQKLGADVVLAKDGEAAVREATAGGIALILMDLQMPGMDGISAARAIRRWEARTGGPRARILAMTGNAPEDYGDACREAGMDGFLTKPVDLAELHDLLAGVAASAVEPAVVAGAAATG
jgi:signal transduction histidine kinase/ActR/RegA family two-component response regulator